MRDSIDSSTPSGSNNSSEFEDYPSLPQPIRRRTETKSTRACDQCKKSRVRCEKSGIDCTHCLRRGKICTTTIIYPRPSVEPIQIPTVEQVVPMIGYQHNRSQSLFDEFINGLNEMQSTVALLQRMANELNIQNRGLYNAGLHLQSVSASLIPLPLTPTSPFSPHSPNSQSTFNFRSNYQLSAYQSTAGLSSESTSSNSSNSDQAINYSEMPQLEEEFEQVERPGQIYGYRYPM